MNKGFMQTFAIILLVLTTLVLLSIRFEIFMMSEAVNPGLISDKSALKYAVQPEAIVMRSGAENSTKLIDKTGIYYMDLSKVLENAIAKSKGLQEITQSEYRAMKDSKNITLSFEPAIDQRLLYGSLFLKDGVLGKIDNIREIVLPQNYSTSLYLKTRDDRYYELKTATTSTLSGMESWESLSSAGKSKYYTLAERFPKDTQSDVLISDDIRLSSYVTESLFDNDEINTRLRNIFGSKYDYANRIFESDGSLILNYDYGREIMKITKGGKVFYHNEDALIEKGRMSLTEAASTAMGFISALTGDRKGYTIEGVREKKIIGSTGYELDFGFWENGVRVSLKNDEPAIRLTIVNGKVFTMEGLFRKGIIAVDNSLSFGENAVLYVLEQNIQYIRSKEPFETTGELFDKIKSVEYAYIYSDNYNFIACYKMVIGNSTFFFKISDAQVVT